MKLNIRIHLGDLWMVTYVKEKVYDMMPLAFWPVSQTTCDLYDNIPSFQLGMYPLTLHEHPLPMG